MKKTWTILIGALLAASVTACGAAPAAPAQPQASSSAPAEPAAAENADDGAKPVAAVEPFVVMDAPRYQGVVDDFAVNDDGKTVLIMKPNHGESGPFTNIAIDESTKFSFDSKELGNGAELEIYYSEPAGGGDATAIAINSLEAIDSADFSDPGGGVPATQDAPGGTAIPADALTYDGLFVSVEFDEGKGSGRLEMTDLEGGNPYIFNFDKENTAINNIDLTALKAGDRLRVRHSPISTRSLPPQSPAYEFSPLEG